MLGGQRSGAFMAILRRMKRGRNCGRQNKSVLRVPVLRVPVRKDLIGLFSDHRLAVFDLFEGNLDVVIRRTSKYLRSPFVKTVATGEAALLAMWFDYTGSQDVPQVPENDET
jgi:hypothetical protein